MRKTWFITLNSNNTDIRYGEPLMQVWQYILSHMSRFCMGDKGCKIESVREKSGIEIGKQDHKVHIHGIVEINSKGTVLLNYSEIKSYVDREMRKYKGFVTSHFDAKLSGPSYEDQIRNMSDYIDKDLE